MTAFKGIEKKENISYDAFISEHLKKRVPVVFKNATSAWKDNKIFTPEFFSKHFGQKKTWSEGVEYTMDEILDITAKSTPENPAPYPVLYEIPTQIPELLEYLEPTHMNYATPNWFSSNLIPYGKFGKNTHLFIGGKGNQYSLHKDFYHTNAWITQLYGEKKFIMFLDGQDDFLYAGKEGFSNFLSPINVVKPDLDKYPNFKNATPYEVTLQPGETIFVPNGIWHTTVAPGHNISFIFDQLNGYNYDAWKKDMYILKKDEGKLKAMLNYGFATAVGVAIKVAELTGKKF